MKNLKEMIKPYCRRIMLASALSLLQMIALFTVPLFGYSDIISSIPLNQVLLIFAVNLILNFGAYYLLLSGLSGITRSIHGPRNLRLLLGSALLVLIFNPVSLYMCGKALTQNEHIRSESIVTLDCSQEVVSIAAFSKGANSGIKAGDIVTAIDGVKVRSVNDIMLATRNRRPGDTLLLRTQRGEFQVELVSEPQSGVPVLGMKFRDASCR